MTTVVVTFFIALLISLVTTPLAARLGRAIGAVDRPDGRKMHRTVVPRSGGIAICIAFVGAILLIQALGTKVSDLLIWDVKLLGFFGGAALVFLTGLMDDIYRLPAKVKLLCHIGSATIAFAAGLRIEGYYFIGTPVNSLLISYVLTVFWFVLLTNAINLIDGLDGLAGGIVFFACAIVAILLIWNANFLAATFYVALGGAVLGFLRYNFNPASVFMGDSGSYFLGYAIAGLSVLCSAKAQTATLVFIPLLAMGVPVFDTILSPVRRFVVGKKLFQPDKSHVHHKLVEMGFSTTKVVLLMYAASVALCLFAIVVVNFHDKRAGFFIIVVAAAAVLFTQKLGYFEYLASDKVIGWFRDITDAAGLSHNRRSFLGLQIEIGHSRTVEELWWNMCQAFEFLKFDRAVFYLGPAWKGGEDDVTVFDGETAVNKGEKSPSTWRTASPDGSSYALHWARPGGPRDGSAESWHMLAVRVPLVDGEPEQAKSLHLMKDTRREHLDSFTFRRVEQLRETVVRTLDWIEREKKEAPEPARRGSPHRKARRSLASPEQSILEKRTGL